MVKCELCGRLFKTPQGLRGHKTFFHDQRARRNEPVELRGNIISKYDDRLERLTKDIHSITETLADLKRKLRYLQGQMASLASRNELHRIALEIDRLNNQVEKHNGWFNPRGLHEAVIGFSGGPIANIEKQLGERQVVNNDIARRKFRHKL
jgi:hypothetical protein